MRILHVVPSYLPALRYGGPIISVHGLCKALAGRGHDVHVFTTNVDGDGESPVPTGIPVDLEGVKVWYFPVPVLRRLYWSPLMKTALDKQMSGFDVLHTHSVFLWPTWAAARVAKSRRVPYFLAPRGMLVRDLIQRKSHWLKSAWIKLIESRNLADAASIHVTSPLEAEELRNLGLRLPEIALVPNGVDIMKPAEASAPAAELQNPPSQPYLLFIGRINWKKGLDRLILALAHMPGTRLLIAGNDEESYRPVLEALAAGHGVTPQLCFLGPVYGAQKALLLERATALVLPSYSENFGNVVLEAMAAGCPVALTAEVGAADIVRKSGAGIIVPGEPQAMAKALSELACNPARRGQACVAAEYSWEAVARAMEVAYLRILRTTNRESWR